MSLRPSPKASRVWAALALLALASPAASADKDPLESLIASEKAAYEEWLAAGEEPPQAYLPGDTGAVELYSPVADASGRLICSDLDPRQLREATGGDPMKPETALNFGLPRVRLLFGDACLVRPGDPVVAVGAGTTEVRTIAEMVVRRDPATCESDSPFSLWGRLDRPLPSAPLFFAVGSSLPEGNFPYVDADSLPAADAGRPQYSRIVDFPEDFTTQAWSLPGSTATLVVLTRVQPGTDDDGLPSMVLAVDEGETLVPLWTERVDLSAGTGRFSIVGVSDFDNDGAPEIVVDGINGRCPYRVIFSSDGQGWAPLPLPIKRCRC